MAQDDYFSFGDEDLESELDFTDFADDSSDLALALAEPPEELAVGEDNSGSAPERAARPRGDSKKGSSERRLPSPGRTRIFVVLALGLLAFALVGVAISAISAGGPVAQNQARTREARPAGPSSADLEARQRAEAIRASRERAAERQRARQHRAQTRRRARRRQRAAAVRHQRAKQRHEREAAQEEAAAAAEAPAPEYVPPAYEAAPPPSTPAPEPAPAPPSGGEIHNGASSPEFGL